MLKRLLIKWFGDKWYCRQFHSLHTTIKGDDNLDYWLCKKCDIKHLKLPSDGDTGIGGKPRCRCTCGNCCCKKRYGSGNAGPG